MGATANVNGRTVVHKGSGGSAPASAPDFCKTPTPPGPPTPMPYPNLANSSDTADGSTTVTVDGNPIMLKDSNFSTSSGDEAGTLKGVASNTNMGIAKFTVYSFDVQVEGKDVPRLGDAMSNNGNGPNTACVAELQEAIPELSYEELEELCVIICACAGNGNQECVADAYSEGYPNYESDRGGNPLAEVGYNNTTSPPTLIESLSGRVGAAGQALPAGLGSFLGQAAAIGQGCCVRWDLVFLENPALSATWDNVRKVIEVKFEGDDWTSNQQNANADDDDDKIAVVHEADCGCE
jgi:uncharacterized protein DUF4150